MAKIPKALTTRSRKRGRKPRPNNTTRKGGAAPGPLTPRGLTDNQGHQEATKQMEMAVRRAKACELFVDQNLTYEQIGKHLGISVATVAKDLHTIFAELKQYAIDKLDSLREVEVRRSLRNDRAILPLLYGQVGKDTVVLKDKVVQVDTVSAASRAHLQIRAHERLTASGASRRAILGLDAPTKVAMTDPTGERRYHELSDAELEKMILERETTLGILRVINVTPPSSNGHNPTTLLVGTGDGSENGHGP